MRPRLRFFSRGITPLPQATSPSCFSLKEASSKMRRPTPRSSIASPERIWSAFAKIDIFAPTRRSRPKPISSNHRRSWRGFNLVNAVDLVLSQEPLQGKAIFDLYDVDVQSTGFPTAYERILDYVEQRRVCRRNGNAPSQDHPLAG